MTRWNLCSSREDPFCAALREPLKALESAVVNAGIRTQILEILTCLGGFAEGDVEWPADCVVAVKDWRISVEHGINSFLSSAMHLMAALEKKTPCFSISLVGRGNCVCCLQWHQLEHPRNC